MNRFDAAAAWDSLPAEAQRAFGIAALISVIGAEGEDRGLAPLQGYIAAAHEGAHAAKMIAADHGLLPDLLRLPDLAIIGVQACPGCGCTDACSCATVGEEPCHWTATGLCSSCAAAAEGQEATFAGKLLVREGGYLLNVEIVDGNETTRAFKIDGSFLSRDENGRWLFVDGFLYGTFRSALLDDGPASDVAAAALSALGVPVLDMGTAQQRVADAGVPLLNITLMERRQAAKGV
ncbi:hypothetical protein [Telmatospirillum sp. J64-1]|uniref:hypothetical protein n=1 Tax=Telmatospirillum sp. J64-1 TaxID=2502183 RepID=UPI00115E1F15|nr:hypothetical protein [Telmatospirillum sp. J64-1]